MVLHWENLSTECYLCCHFILLREWMRTDDGDDDCPQPNEVRGRGESPARDGAFKPLILWENSGDCQMSYKDFEAKLDPNRDDRLSCFSVIGCMLSCHWTKASTVSSFRSFSSLHLR
jgi:hypothetical protein